MTCFQHPGCRYRFPSRNEEKPILCDNYGFCKPDDECFRDIPTKEEQELGERIKEQMAKKQDDETIYIVVQQHISDDTATRVVGAFKDKVVASNVVKEQDRNNGPDYAVWVEEVYLQ